MYTLYPDIQPYAEHRLAVGEPHDLHVEECGNPQGIPVVFIHGGPGAGYQHWNRSFFDPQKYRIVLFDQRGSGRSTPHACLEDNTTADLIADMERIREYLGIDRWMLFGGSWGSTLALAYAECWPQRVMAMVLRGIFLCRPEDLFWFYQDGASRIFPDAWNEYIRVIPETERGDFIKAFHRRLTGDDELQRMAAAKAWSIWEGSCSTLRPNTQVVDHFANPHTALSLARIEAHYFVNDIFLDANQLLRDAEKLNGIPGVIVHGRYDMVCPIDGAFTLHKAWPGSELKIIRDAGHSASEPGIVDALIRATDHFARELG